MIFELSYKHGCCEKPGLRVRNYQGQEIGMIQEGYLPCGDRCCIMCCAFCCRRPDVPAWAWLRAVDSAGRERLTFRHPALPAQCCACCACTPPPVMPEKEPVNCCSLLYRLCCPICYLCGLANAPPPPDIPFRTTHQLYGPLNQPRPMGQIDVAGARGYDKKCCQSTYGVRREMAATVMMVPSMPYEESTLAILMGMYMLKDANLEYSTTFRRMMPLPYLLPAAPQVMKMPTMVKHKKQKNQVTRD